MSPRVEAALVGVLVLAYHVLRRPPSFITLPGSFNDDGVYLVLGRALAQGLGYRSYHLAGEPVQLKYPPGLPGLLAVLWRLTGNLDAVVGLARLLNLVLVGAAAAIFWSIARRRFGLHPVLAALAVAPLLLEETLQYWSLVVAEPYFVFGWAVALALALRLAQREPRATVGDGAVLGLVLATTALFRTQAAVLIPAFVLVLALERKTRRASVACLIAGAVPLVAWSLAKVALHRAGPVSTLPDEGSYLEWLPVGDPSRWAGFIGSVLGENLLYYGWAFGRLATVSTAGWPVVVLFVLAAIAGGASRDQRRLLVALPTLAAAGTVLFWPWLQARLALPLLPAAGLLAGLGCQGLAARLPAPVRRGAGVALGAALALLVLVQARVRSAALADLRGGGSRKVFLAVDYLASQSRLLALTSGWVEEHTQPNEVVVFDLPAGLYLLTGRHVSPASPAESRYVTSVHAVPGRYLAERILADRATVVVVPFGTLYIARDVRAVAAACPGSLQLEATFRPMGYPEIYRIATDPVTQACLGAVRDGGARTP